MVDRSDEPRLTTPIVPDSDSEMIARHRSAPVRLRRTRTWPLWLACLLLCAGLVALGVYYWLDRQTWLANQRQLAGQLSNLHARLDSLGDSRNASSSDLEQRLADLQSAQQMLQTELSDLETTLSSLEESSADSVALDELAQRFQAAEEERDTLAATMEAMQRSLDILEQSGEEARAVLTARLDDVEAALAEAERQRQALAEVDGEFESRLAQLDTIQERLQASLESLSSGTQGEVLAALETRLDELAGAVETLRSDDTAQQERLDQLSSRIEASQTSLTELRQNQLALNATIEGMGGAQGISPQQLEELEVRMESLEASRRQLTGRVASLLTDVNDLQRRVGP